MAWMVDPDSDELTLWDDRRIRAVVGVNSVWRYTTWPAYAVRIDPRYVEAEVKDEIEAIIMEGSMPCDS